MDKWAKFDKNHQKKPGNPCGCQKKVVSLQRFLVKSERVKE